MIREAEAARRDVSADVLIVGGGPAGLAAAKALRQHGAGRVVVVEREAEAGGIPRHSDHPGYGVLDLHRPLTGPAYARRLVDLAADAGAEIWTETSVTSWAPVADGGEAARGRTLETTSPAGLQRISAGAVVLATGCRERPRSARLIPGPRPAGIYTTGQLQQAVHLKDAPIGRRAVVVGAEHVSYSALLTLAHAKVKAVALVTEHARHQSYGPIVAATATRMRVPLLAGQRMVGIVGRERVEGVEIADLATGATRTIACDVLVFTADWIPDHEIARLGGLDMDAGTLGPRIDAAFATSVPGVFAVGNLLHGAETSDVVTGEGSRVAAPVAAWLARGGDATPAAARVPIAVSEPVAWVTPNAVRGTETGPVSLRVSRIVERGVIEVAQGERVLWRGHGRTGMLSMLGHLVPSRLAAGVLVPGRAIHIPGDWLRDVRADGPAPVVRVRE
jgi:thioredoxin reductase